MQARGQLTREELERRIWLKCSACPEKTISAGQLQCKRRRCRYKSVQRWLGELKELDGR